MTISTVKNPQDKVFIYNEGKMSIEEGLIDSIQAEVRSMDPTKEPYQRITYLVKTTSGSIFRNEDQIFDTAEAVLAKIKANSWLA